MTRRPHPFASDLALVASTALATLALHRHFGRDAPTRSPDPDAPLPVTRAGNPLAVISSHGADILSGTYARINRDRILANAAGVVFYGLLAIFPAITALVSSYGLFADPSTISDNLRSLALLLPGDSFTIVQDEITRVVAKASSSLSLAFGFGLLLAIWSVNAGVKAVLDALNVAYEVDEKRGLIHLNLVSLAFTVAGLAAVLVMVGAVTTACAAGAPASRPSTMQRLATGPDRLPGRCWAWPCSCALLALYGFGPSRPTPKLRWLVIGAVVRHRLVADRIGLIVLVSLELRQLHRRPMAPLGSSHRPQATWMWLSAIIVLVGAELNSEIERQALPRDCPKA